MLVDLLDVGVRGESTRRLGSGFVARAQGSVSIRSHASASVKTLTMAVASGSLFGSSAFAAPSVSSPEMVKALAKAEEGPTELRRFVQRTKPIYCLDYFEVMSIHEAQKALASEKPMVAGVERK